MRRWRHLKLRRGQFFGGAAFSAVPAVPPPRLLRQPGVRPRAGARLLPSRRRQWAPVPPQASQGQQRPSFTRQAGARRPGRIRHGAFLAVPVTASAPPPPVSTGLLMAMGM